MCGVYEVSSKDGCRSSDARERCGLIEGIVIEEKNCGGFATRDPKRKGMKKSISLSTIRYMSHVLSATRYHKSRTGHYRK
ncbi:hypothetical protein EVAR_40200_1 [Eumeta japonica]|uniref:Uncharacterized protein n=1 Tax=Eumeta variegata TaxID=151549 RepID=A0A4C1XP01_EUMVA|nr:hypothetical protein EVAR_40200_1 [Eumeta japonica]